MTLFARQKAISSHELPELRSSRLTLRAIAVSDAEAVYDAIVGSRPEFERWFTWAHETTLATVRQNLQEAGLSMAAGSEWHYGIFGRQGEFRGRVGLSEIDHIRRRAELGYWLDVHYHGRGYMTEAVQLLTALVLVDPRPLRLDAFADVENIASQRVLSKCGFERVGSVVNAVNHPLRGWRDQYQYALIHKM